MAASRPPGECRKKKNTVNIPNFIGATFHDQELHCVYIRRTKMLQLLAERVSDKPSKIIDALE
jgi:hypothetical protein